MNFCLTEAETFCIIADQGNEARLMAKVNRRGGTSQDDEESV